MLRVDVPFMSPSNQELFEVSSLEVKRTGFGIRKALGKLPGPS